MNSRNILFFTSIFLFSTLFTSCGKKFTEEDLRGQARQFEQEEKYEDALKTYQEQLKRYPQGKYADETVQKIAYIYYNNLKDFHRAIEYHQKLISDYPQSKFISKARFMTGYIYANDIYDYDSAEAAYKEFLKHHPEDELVESVRWELEHLGEDINEQLKDLFTNEEASAAKATSN
ncbi:MAG: tetratricopeptide repeat protein [bacterium]